MRMGTHRQIRFCFQSSAGPRFTNASYRSIISGSSSDSEPIAKPPSVVEIIDWILETSALFLKVLFRTQTETYFLVTNSQRCNPPSLLNELCILPTLS